MQTEITIRIVAEDNEALEAVRKLLSMADERPVQSDCPPLAIAPPAEDKQAPEVEKPKRDRAPKATVEAPPVGAGTEPVGTVPGTGPDTSPEQDLSQLTVQDLLNACADLHTALGAGPDKKKFAQDLVLKWGGAAKCREVPAEKRGLLFSKLQDAIQEATQNAAA